MAEQAYALRYARAFEQVAAAQKLDRVQVQQQLQGRSDDDVRVLAGVPADLEAVAVVDAAPVARSFWSADAADADVSAAVVVTGDAPDDGDVSAVKERRAYEHVSGVTVVLPGTTRAPTADDVQAILSAVVSTMVARGLLATSSDTPIHTQIDKEKP